MEDNKTFPPVVDLSTRTELRWTNPLQPLRLDGGPAKAGPPQEAPTMKTFLGQQSQKVEE